MNGRIRVIAASLPILWACASCDSPPVQSKLSQETPDLCPEKHTNLKMVPILYGLVPVGEARERINNHKAVLAGTCIVGPEKEMLICQTCGYKYLPQSFSWEKTTQVVSSFDPPLNKVLYEFRLPFQASYSYQRIVKPDDMIEDNMFIEFKNIEYEQRADVVVDKLLVAAGASDIKNGTLTIYEESSVRESLAGSRKLIAESEGKKVEVLILIKAERTILGLTVR